MNPVDNPLPPEPAELPVMKRRLRFGAWQLVGLALIGLIPVLAMFKVFGSGGAVATGRAGVISIVVDYPPRIRFGSASSITASITNSGGSLLDTLRVRFDSSYVARVSEPRFVPSAIRAFEIELIDVAPGEVRRAELAFYAHDYGRHRGFVAVSHGGDTARVMISTIVFP